MCFHDVFMDETKDNTYCLKDDDHRPWKGDLATPSLVFYARSWVKMGHLIFRWQSAGRIVSRWSFATLVTWAVVMQTLEEKVVLKDRRDQGWAEAGGWRRAAGAAGRREGSGREGGLPSLWAALRGSSNTCEELESFSKQSLVPGHFPWRLTIFWDWTMWVGFQRVTIGGLASRPSSAIHQLADSGQTTSLSRVGFLILKGTFMISASPCRFWGSDKNSKSWNPL